MYLLDTNVVISALNERCPAISRRLDAELASRTPVLISTIVLFEMRYGIAKSQSPAKSEAALAQFLASRIAIIPFEASDADHAGDIRGHLARLGTPIGPYDVLLAGQARSRGLVLVTANRREFDRVPGLMVADWGA